MKQNATNAFKLYREMCFFFNEILLNQEDKRNKYLHDQSLPNSSIVNATLKKQLENENKTITKNV